MPRYTDQTALVFRLSRYSLSVLIVACLIIIGGLAINARAWLAALRRDEQPTPINKSEAPVPSLPQGNSKQEQGEVVLITLRQTGFEPAEMTLPTGHFLLVVRKNDVPEDITLRLDQENGGRLREVRRSKSQRRYQDLLDLHPGRYVLTEANHPEWMCRFIITNQH